MALGYTKKEQREALANVSSLKRALGIANHPSKQDTFRFQEIQIFTQDRESAVLLGELLFRYGNGNQAAYYNAHPESFTVRDTIKLTALSDGFETSMMIPSPTVFSRAIQKMIEKHIAPDKNPGR